MSNNNSNKNLSSTILLEEHIRMKIILKFNNLIIILISGINNLKVNLNNKNNNKSSATIFNKIANTLNNSNNLTLMISKDNNQYFNLQKHIYSKVNLFNKTSKNRNLLSKRMLDSNNKMKREKKRNPLSKRIMDFNNKTKREKNIFQFNLLDIKNSKL